MHAAIFVYVRGSWNSSWSCLSCSSNTTQTRLCLTINSFPKSRLFANVIVFKLFDLPKSRLKSRTNSNPNCNWKESVISRLLVWVTDTHEWISATTCFLLIVVVVSTVLGVLSCSSFMQFTAAERSVVPCMHTTTVVMCRCYRWKTGRYWIHWYTCDWVYSCEFLHLFMGGFRRPSGSTPRIPSHPSTNWSSRRSLP